MRNVGLFAAVLATAATMGVSNAAAGGRSPAPVPGEASCGGLLVAINNHYSASPSGNPKASAGPGTMFGRDTHLAIEAPRAGYCGG